MKKRKIHLICNAHLDPVWLWQWPEGVAAALSTFRTAAQLAEENDTFIFNHNEVILYQWIQEYEPPLFKQIQKLVKQKKWHIMGGWFLQPDGNMPSGESFVRQILAGRTYFKKYFNVQPKTAINFDPFGFTRGLVQILAKSGYDSHLFGRPEPRFLDLPGIDFLWRGFDGSEIIATRFSGWYNTPLGNAVTVIKERIDAVPDKKALAVLWGVGNHGGGPSRKDIRDISQFIKKSSEKLCIEHSTPEQYFSDIKKSRGQLPVYSKGLNPWAVGCYVSQIQIKQKHRLLENELYSLEKIVSAAYANGLMEYPSFQIQQAQRDLMFAQFHDILPGSSIQPVENDALRMLDHGLEICSQLKTRAFLAMAQSQPPAKPDTIPIIVYNPHPFAAEETVECEFNLPDFPNPNAFTQVEVYHNSRLIPSQSEKESSNLPSDWRKRVVFKATLPPSQISRFDCRLKVTDKKPAIKLVPRNNQIRIKNENLEIVINTKTGLVDRYKVNGKECLKKNAFRPMVLADNADPWGMTLTNFKKVIGKFELMSPKECAEYLNIRSETISPVRVIEDGPVRTVVEVLLKYHRSFICQQYQIPKSGTEIGLSMRVFWDEKDKIVKLSIPTSLRSPRYVGQTAYGVEEMPTDGTEAVSQRWCAVISRKDNIALTCINDCVYSSDFSEGTFRMSLLRSPAYSAPSDEKGYVDLQQDRFIPRIDQGFHAFQFWFDAGSVTKSIGRVDRKAMAKNEKPVILSFFPSGKAAACKPLAILDDQVVQITAIKKAEQGNYLIFRIFEPTGRMRSTKLSLPGLNKKIKLKLNPFEIKTLRVNMRNGEIVETDLMESPLK